MTISKDGDGRVFLQNEDVVQHWFTVSSDFHLELHDIMPAKGGGGFEFLLVSKEGWVKCLLYATPYNLEVREWIMDMRDALGSILDAELTVVKSADC
jgi:hypothetical protein